MKMCDDAVSYSQHRFPAHLICHCVWLYFRFPLSLRNIRDMLMAQGVHVSHESIRSWCRKYGDLYASAIRGRTHAPGDRWHLDEVFLRIKGQQKYLWRAVDQEGTVLGVMVQQARDQSAASRFIQQLVEEYQQGPREVVTDKLRSYVAPCAELLTQATHRQTKALNNRVENSHQPTRLRERQMRGFKSVQHAQRFLSVFSAIGNLFNVSEHLLSAANRRTLQEQRLRVWAAITGMESG